MRHGGNDVAKLTLILAMCDHLLMKKTDLRIENMMSIAFENSIRK